MVRLYFSTHLTMWLALPNGMWTELGVSFLNGSFKRWYAMYFIVSLFHGLWKLCWHKASISLRPWVTMSLTLFWARLNMWDEQEIIIFSVKLLTFWGLFVCSHSLSGLYWLIYYFIKFCEALYKIEVFMQCLPNGRHSINGRYFIFAMNIIWDAFGCR